MSRKVRLEVLGPVHITAYGGWEGDLSSLADRVKERGVSLSELLDKLMEAIPANNTTEEKDKFKNFIEQWGIIIEELREFVKDGLGNVYIPGSSVKGALRTKYFDKLFSNSPGIKRKLVLYLKRTGLGKKTFNLFLSKELGVDSYNDPFRGVLVSDLYPVEGKEPDTECEWCKVMVRKRPEYEFVVRGEFEGRIKVEKKAFEYFWETADLPDRQKIKDLAIVRDEEDLFQKLGGNRGTQGLSLELRIGRFTGYPEKVIANTLRSISSGVWQYNRDYGKYLSNKGRPVQCKGKKYGPGMVGKVRLVLV